MAFTLSNYLRRGYNFVERIGIRQYRQRLVKRNIMVQDYEEYEDSKNLEQVMAERNQPDPEIDFKVDIGYKFTRPSRKEVLLERINVRKALKARLDMEKAAKARILSVPMDDVYKEWCSTNGPFHIKTIAEYFNIFNDLFGDAYFTANTTLNIHYPLEDADALVYQGNLLKPSETAVKPNVTFNAQRDALYTLIMTTPDCHFTQKGAEYLHWMVGNIREGDITKGKEICDYLQPFPPRGLGYCRYVFVLFRQEKVIDFSKHQRPENCKNLAARTFSTLDFYRELQDVMTPCGLGFFQSNWDSSLTNFFHNVLEMKEPWFEYDFPVTTLSPQLHYPFGSAFNLYLDRYKDAKQLGKELLLEKLKEVHPFERPPPPLKYPGIIPIKDRNSPTWLNDEIKRRRRKIGKWKYM